ncbi:hypothetical protein ACFWRZ_08960 [Streptomyces rubiginosohelvolus]|uniref:hypothetical protein n=1 Tax=Streptomyces rubiginosohelvolus TaxID=67362 RepID=UPI00364B8074
MTPALSPRPRRLVPAVAASMAAFTALALLAACGDGRDDSTSTLPSCPVSRTGLVDMVPSGPRPCVLHGTGSQTGGGPAIPGGGTAKTPKGDVKVPKAPAPKVPAAPAPKPPSLTKR